MLCQTKMVRDREDREREEVREQEKDREEE
jgi:hypothetical protein